MKKDTKAYGYMYTKEEDILAKITVFMEKYNLSLIPNIVPGTTVVSPYTYKKTKSTNKGEIYEENVNEIIVQADTTWTWVNNDNPDERIEVSWAMVGSQSDASQSFGSGLTYSSRYFLLKYFNISTSNDDPDNFRSKQKAAEDEADRVVTQAIVEEVDETIKAYLAEHPDKKDDVKNIVTKYAKGGNYFSIDKSVIAAKLLDDLKENLN